MRGSFKGFHMMSPVMNAKLPQNNTPTTSPTSIDKQVLRHIPGEKQLTNDLKDRLPQFPLSRSTVPTLLPRPGVPLSGEPGMTFRKMIQILKNKKEPELIYELEPHRLYFIICGCFALVFAFYAWNIGAISYGLAWNIFLNNELELPEVQRYINSFAQFLLATALVGMPLLVMIVFIMLPTRLIRRMWYLPGEVEQIQFITHPILPNTPSPIITVPLQSLARAHKSKIYTARGFYGTVDSTIFFFLREKGNRIPWIVDRKGFFWGDGRVFDLLFGKESVLEAEQGLTLNEKQEILNQRRKLGEEKLKKELGPTWRLQLQGKLMLDDIRQLKSIVKKSPKKQISGKK